jgi:NAD(P)H-dependent FMN reductase
MRLLHTPVVLGTCRTGSMSQHVARFVLAQLEEFPSVQAEFLDLSTLKMPMFEERIGQMAAAPRGVRLFCEAIDAAHAILIIAPEYKNGYPGALKNALDYLPPRAFHHKPVGIITVSSGQGGGSNCLWQLRQVCLGLSGLPIPDQVLASNVSAIFDEDGNLREPKFGHQLRTFLEEFLWYANALAKELTAAALPA